MLPPWRVLIVDDHPIVRTGLASLIDAETDLTVCGHAADVDEALRALDALSPDVALVDLSLRTSNGLEFVREASRRGVRPIVVSMQDKPIWVERCLEAGAVGYVLKSDAGRCVVTAIQRARARRIYVSESMSEQLLAHRHARDPDASHTGVDALTDRELEVLTGIGQGKTTLEIAQQLEISAKTVQTYRERIKRKLGIDSAAGLSSEATRWVVEHGQRDTPAT